MDELDALRKKRLAELQAQAESEQMQTEQVEQAESQIKQVLSQILTPESRSRLATIKMAKPEFASQVEMLLIQLAKSGQIQSKISDEQFKAILTKISKPKKDFNIRRV